MSIKENQLAELAAQLNMCTSCHLRSDCQAPVGWYGSPDSPIVFIGEGPGGVEDDYGCPLIGPSGQLLDKALWSVQMTRLQPKVIVALGSVAMHYLGDPAMRITRQRGKWFKTQQGYDCIATFHPSYILRQYGHAQVQAKWDVYHDLQLARAKAVEACPDYNLCSEKPVDLFVEFKKRQ